MVTEITKDQFDSTVLKSELPVMVEFYGLTCPSCQAMLPVIEKISENFSGRLAVYKVNLYQNPILANIYGVIAIPNFMFFKNGKSITKLVGSQPVSVMQETIKSIISEDA